MFTKRCKLSISLLLMGLCAMAQVDSAKLVEYTPDFKFKEGLYLNFNQLKNNNPLPKSRIITTYDLNDPNFFDQVLTNDVILYYDHLGNKSELKTKNVWGYSRNGFIYIRMDDGYFRITQVGAISHFVASQTTYYNNYNSAYSSSYYYDPYRRYPTNTYKNTEIRQYLFDFINGRVLDYTEESLSILLMADPELHDEYESLRRKKRKQMRFIFIRKFNERNKLYFPKN